MARSGSYACCRLPQGERRLSETHLRVGSLSVVGFRPEEELEGKRVNVDLLPLGEVVARGEVAGRAGEENVLEEEELVLKDCFYWEVVEFEGDYEQECDCERNFEGEDWDQK